MHVRTLTGQTVSIAQQVDALHLMTIRDDYASPANVAFSKRLGKQIAAACGSHALQDVLINLRLHLLGQHHDHLSGLWCRIAAQANADAQENSPVDHESIAFDLAWGACSYSRCEQALVSAKSVTGKPIARLTVADLQAQGVREALAESFLSLVQVPKRLRAAS